MVFNPGSTKRQKEAARRDKQRKKGELPGSPLSPGEDPDIAGIVPGPQPIAED
jgi:hypothetical protein